MHRIALIGPPASGKGTQARRIVNLLGIPVLGTGAMLRREVESGSELGREVDVFLKQGNYVPDALIMRMVDSWLSEQGEGGWMLDGFPRTLKQAESLEANKAFAPTLVIGLEVPVHELERRITSRRECGECGTTVSVQTADEKDCPSCSNGELKLRSDDHLQSFRVRYKNYLEQTQVLYEYYRAQGKLLLVDGSHSPDAVFEVIHNFLMTQYSHGQA